MRWWNGISKPARSAALAALAACATAGLVAQPGQARAVKGELSPDFTGTTLDGKTITLAEVRGRNPVVLNFFAEFCVPCRREFPHLKALDTKLRPRGLRVVAVSQDPDRETAAVLPREQNVKFPVLLDPRGEIAEKSGVQAIPHTVVIDREGRVHTVLIGLDPEGLDKAVSQVMK